MQALGEAGELLLGREGLDGGVARRVEGAVMVVELHDAWIGEDLALECADVLEIDSLGEEGAADVGGGEGSTVAREAGKDPIFETLGDDEALGGRALAAQGLGEMAHGAPGLLVGDPGLDVGAQLGTCVVVGGFLRLGATPSVCEVGVDLGVGDVLVPILLVAIFANLEGQGLGVEIDVEAVAVTGERGVDGLSRGPIVAEEEDAVRGRPLGGRDREGVAVVDPDVAMEIAHLVGVERDLSAKLGSGLDAHAITPELRV